MELTKEHFDQQLGNLATKRDLDSLPQQEDYEQVKQEIRTIKSDLQEIKQIVSRIDRRDAEDSNAFAKTVVNHDQRLKIVEQELKNLKLKQA